MNGQGKAAAAKLKAPAALLLAEPEAWNMHGNAQALADAIPGEKLLHRIPSATHLDAEWPTDLLGQLACGFVDEKRQQQFREKATEFLTKTLQAAPSVAAGVSTPEATQEIPERNSR